MARRLVRQFKTQAAPADARGYTPQAVAQVIAPAAVDDPTVPRPAAHYGTLETPVARPAVAAAVDAYIPPPAVAQTPRTMGTPALPPDWYPETPNRIWSPDATTGTRRNTGADDIYDIPPVQRPTVTTTNAPINETGVFPQTEPEFVEATLTPNVPQQPWFVPPTATAATVQLPPQRPVAPPDYGQPPVPVDITPEQFTLPSPTVYPGENIPLPAYDRGIIPEVPPITTPIERPTPIDIGYIEPEQPIDLTPGPQVTATEQSFYNPQPVETAYAAPIEVPYPQPQLTESSPAAHYGELPVPQDEITNLIDTIIPKTIDIPQKGPQWVEDPYGLATQELIDQSGFTQTDPSIYSPAMPPIIGEAPEITLADQIQQEDPYVIDYSDTYGEPILPQQELPQIFTPEPILGEPEVILPQEVGMPEIPTAATTTSRPDERVYPEQEGDMVRDPENLESGPSHFVRDTLWDPEGDTGGQYSGSGVWEYAHDPLADPTQDIRLRRLIGTEGEGEPVGRASAAPTIETTVPAKTITPSGEVVDEADKTYTVDTEAGLDITQLPETAIAGEPAEGPMIEQIAETPETFVPKDVPPPPAVVEGGGEVVTQPPPPVSGPDVQQGALTAPGPGGWLYTGPQGYAQTRWSTSGAAQGDPVISYTPAVSGPQVNRETGEITEQPLSWWSNRAGYDFMQPGAELPTGKVGGNTVPGAPSPPTGTETGTGTWQQGAEPSPLPRNLHKNDWTSSVTSTANVQNFLDEATRAGVPVVQVDGFGNPRINFSSSTWSTASDAGVDAEGLSKINFKDTDGNTRNAFEVGVNFVGKGIKGAYNLVFGNSGDQSAKDLASNLGEKETASFGKRVKALWKEYAMPFETDDKDPNNLVNPLTGEIQKKGDMQYGFMYNVVTGNIPALAGQMGLHIGHKVFEGLSQGLKRVFGSDVLQSVTSGVMDTLKFAGNKMGQFLGLDAFNKKIESKDFETQEMQDWEQAYGEGAKGKEEGEEEIEGTDPEWMKIWDTLQIDALNPHGIGEGDAPPEFSVEAFDKKLQAGEVTDVSGEGTRFAVFTDRTGQILSTNALNVGSKSWSDADKINVVKGGDGNAWAVVREGGVEVSRPITHGWGANKTPVKANEFGDQGVGGGGGGGLLKTIWEWITSKRE